MTVPGCSHPARYGDVVAKPSMWSFLPVVIAACSVPGCSSSNRADSPEAVFRAWNKAAVAGDATAASFLCSNPSDETSYDSSIAEYGSGFPAALRRGLTVNIDGGRAVLDFTDPGTSDTGDEEDVFVALVKQGGTWKVCRVRVTVEGGIG